VGEGIEQGAAEVHRQRPALGRHFLLGVAIGAFAGLLLVLLLVART
jgi:hypothetical protein